MVDQDGRHRGGRKHPGRNRGERKHNTKIKDCDSIEENINVNKTI